MKIMSIHALYYVESQSLAPSGVATIEVTEAAASVKMFNNRLSRPEYWHPGFSTQTLLLRQHYCTTHMAVVLSRAEAYGDTVLVHFSATQLNSVVKRYALHSYLSLA